ncbi:MAG: PLP-dependent cysteine synthase family protein [Rhodothermales bacterium]
MTEQIDTLAANRTASVAVASLEAIQVPDVVKAIGSTHLIRLERIGTDLSEGVSLYAKAEHLNPSGSVKDRAARQMILEGLANGALHPDKTLIDATSGNTGIAYAMIGGRLGIPVTLAMPANASLERRKMMKAHGAELILTDPLEGTDGAQRHVKELVAANPDRYFYPDQYNNDANWRAHYEGTGVEILEQTGGRITHFVTGLGTTGTFTGVSRRLKETGDVRTIAVEPDSPMHAIEGLKHLETALVPGIYDNSLVDRLVRVSTEEARRMARRLAREEGLLVGGSSGANVTAALQIASELTRGVVVTVLCDTGTRYLSDSMWDIDETA